MSISTIERWAFVEPDNSQIFIVQRNDVLNFRRRKISTPAWANMRFAIAKIVIEEIDGTPDSLWVTEGEYERCDAEGLIYTKYMADKLHAYCRLKTPTDANRVLSRDRLDQRLIDESQWHCNRQTNGHLFEALSAHFLTASETPFVKRSSDNPSFLRRKL